MNNWNLIKHINRQKAFSLETFGPAAGTGARAAGICNHIRKELKEVEANPTDLLEWVDVILLALDGAWRAGYSADEICAGIDAKQHTNEVRVWPDWQTAEPGKAIEHIPTDDEMHADDYPFVTLHPHSAMPLQMEEPAFNPAVDMPGSWKDALLILREWSSSARHPTFSKDRCGKVAWFLGRQIDDLQFVNKDSVSLLYSTKSELAMALARAITSEREAKETRDLYAAECEMVDALRLELASMKK